MNATNFIKSLVAALAVAAAVNYSLLPSSASAASLAISETLSVASNNQGAETASERKAGIMEQLNCSTDTQCEKKAAKRIASNEKKIEKLRESIAKHRDAIIKANDKLQALKAVNEQLLDDSKQ